MLAAMDQQGVSLEALLQLGGSNDPLGDVTALALDPTKIRGFIEVHIEQVRF
jgi:hypothetical protein